MGLVDELSRQLEGDGVRGLSERLGASEEQTRAALKASVPALLRGVANNARRRGGTHDLGRVLERQEFDGRLLEDMGGVLEGRHDETGDQVVETVFGDNRGAVEQSIGQFAGLDKGQISRLLVMLAPLLLNVLGKMKQSGASSGEVGRVLRREERTHRRSGGDVADILEGVLRGSGQGQAQAGGCGNLGGLLGGLMGGR